MRRIFVYISSLLLCLAVNTAIAQKKKPIPIPPDSTRWLNGFTVQADVASLMTSTLMSHVTYSAEGGIQLDLKHRIFPTLELGVAGADKISTDNIGYKTNSLFERIGVDFNLRKRKIDSKPTNNLFIAGVRLGMSHFNYDVTNVTIADNYWGSSVPLNYLNQSVTKIWYEFVVGVQVEVIKNFYMGWTIRNKNLISQDALGKVAPWYIPGFGQNNGSSWGFNYTLGYHFGPGPKKKNSRTVQTLPNQIINNQITK
ncbi:MAG: DUF6048 family protein [Bacteroidota bacterium]|nr:DUF6048 family protein [Bacteroidota bacterium]